MLKRALLEKINEQGSLSGRRFALLQGPSSPFFANLGRALRLQGAEVVRIGFCPGDRLYWRKSSGRYVPYRGKPSNFQGWLVEFVSRHAISDILMLGDGREPHATAIKAKSENGIDAQIWVVEHGYLRPNLILIEPGGMGGNSGIPAKYDPSSELEAEIDSFDFKPNFVRYAALDIAYNVSNLALAWMSYPFYRAHSGISPLKEYAGWVSKILRTPARRRRCRDAEAKIARHTGPLFLFPLQLSHDFQLRRYGTGEDQATVLHQVIASFECHAPKDALLVIKVHPLDNGLTDWGGIVVRQAKTAQVVFLDDSDLGTLLDRTTGVATINSTVGLSALLAGCATCVLGQALYDLPDLTHKGGLNALWVAPSRPKAKAAQHFERYLRANWHVPGAFDGPGSSCGARALAAWLAAPPPEREASR